MFFISITLGGFTDIYDLAIVNIAYPGQAVKHAAKQFI